MKVAIVKYNGGNTVSVANALTRLGAESIITNSAEDLAQADRVIIPGVGEASSAMASLRNVGLDTLIPRLAQPVLGICLGLQLLCSHSEENDTTCLGILPDCVRKFRDIDIKVPHTGWNTISDLASPLFAGVEENAHMFFVHSFYVEAGESAIATTEYDTSFASAVAKDNFYGVQFHPEKSGDCGARILENFLNI